MGVSLPLNTRKSENQKEREGLRRLHSCFQKNLQRIIKRLIEGDFTAKYGGFARALRAQGNFAFTSPHNSVRQSASKIYPIWEARLGSDSCS
jgi:hypothetical protein